ncbi:VanZ family protein [Gottschalkiaceae bacterium SANA]|nr:VanZ family protein [Gottschalkiaceae bacterium SANA]
MELTRSRTIIIVIAWSLVLLWMGVIYSLSSQVAVESNALSHGVTEVIVEAVQTVVPSAEFDVDDFNHLIRKNAHLLAYLILGFLVSHAFARNGLHGRENARHTLIICVLYALSDEMHQMMVPGRGPALMDVMIDSLGVCIGLSLYYFIHVARKRVRRKIIE